MLDSVRPVCKSEGLCRKHCIRCIEGRIVTTEMHATCQPFGLDFESILVEISEESIPVRNLQVRFMQRAIDTQEVGFSNEGDNVAIIPLETSVGSQDRHSRHLESVEIRQIAARPVWREVQIDGLL